MNVLDSKQMLVTALEGITAKTGQVPERFVISNEAYHLITGRDPQVPSRTTYAIRLAQGSSYIFSESQHALHPKSPAIPRSLHDLKSKIRSLNIELNITVAQLVHELAELGIDK